MARYQITFLCAAVLVLAGADTASAGPLAAIGGAAAGGGLFGGLGGALSLVKTAFGIFTTLAGAGGGNDAAAAAAEREAEQRRVQAEYARQKADVNAAHARLQADEQRSDLTASFGGSGSTPDSGDYRKAVQRNLHYGDLSVGQEIQAGEAEAAGFVNMANDARARAQDYRNAAKVERRNAAFSAVGSGLGWAMKYSGGGGSGGSGPVTI